MYAVRAPGGRTPACFHHPKQFVRLFARWFVCCANFDRKLVIQVGVPFECSVTEIQFPSDSRGRLRMTQRRDDDIECWKRDERRETITFSTVYSLNKHSTRNLKGIWVCVVKGTGTGMRRNIRIRPKLNHYFDRCEALINEQNNLFFSPEEEKEEGKRTDSHGGRWRQSSTGAKSRLKGSRGSRMLPLWAILYFVSVWILTNDFWEKCFKCYLLAQYQPTLLDLLFSRVLQVVVTSIVFCSCGSGSPGYLFLPGDIARVSIWNHFVSILLLLCNSPPDSAKAGETWEFGGGEKWRLWRGPARETRTATTASVATHIHAVSLWLMGRRCRMSPGVRIRDRIEGKVLLLPRWRTGEGGSNSSSNSQPAIGTAGLILWLNLCTRYER